MSTLYLSAAIAHQAEITQGQHSADKDDWCGFCLRHHRIRVRAGECAPFQRAAGFIAEFKRQRQRLSRPSSRSPSA